MKRELRIASPCSADWDRMVGDERVRHCAECNLDVYNFSAMASAEVEQIVAEREGRLCARFYQRPDGTMLTQNCPVGFRAVVRHVSRVASAALTAVLTTSPALAGSVLPKRNPSLLQIQAAQTVLALNVVDTVGAIIPNATIIIVNEKTGSKTQAVTDADGQVRLLDLPAGTYNIEVSASGFRTRRQDHVAVPASNPLRLSLEVAPVLMGVVIEVQGPELETSKVSDFIPTPVSAKSDLRPQSNPQANRARRFFSHLRRAF